MVESSDAGLQLERFAVRPARLDDAEAIARVHVASWQSAYRGILPPDVIDRHDVGHRIATRRRILRDRDGFHLVAHDTTYGDIVGFCDAGDARRDGPWHGEVYAIYLLPNVRFHGIGRTMFERVMAWMRTQEMRSMIVWVLEHNPHARRFYEALGGRAAERANSMVGGFPVVEVGYVWDRL
jgi:GNAT superfamily N-acetyltransferase